MGDFAKHIQVLRNEVEKVKSLLALQDLVLLLEQSDGVVRQAEANTLEMARLRESLAKAQRSHTDKTLALETDLRERSAAIEAQVQAHALRLAQIQNQITVTQSECETKKSEGNLAIHALKEEKRLLQQELTQIHGTIDQVRADHAAFLKKVAG